LNELAPTDTLKSEVILAMQKVIEMWKKRMLSSGNSSYVSECKLIMNNNRLV
jgi:hypothetical protein